MFGIGTFEFLVIILVAVLVLGPEHLPRVMRTVTKVMSDFRRINTDFQRAINLEANKEDYRQKYGDDAFKAANDALKPKKKTVKKKKKKAPATAPDDAVAAASGTDTTAPSAAGAPLAAAAAASSSSIAAAAASDSSIAAAAVIADSAAVDPTAEDANTAHDTNASPAAPVHEEATPPMRSAQGLAATLGDLPEAELTLDEPQIPGAGQVKSPRLLSTPGIDVDSIPLQGGRA